MTSKPLAVVLVSGGMDSCVTAAVTQQECDLALLHVKYGQRTEKREHEAFRNVADFYEVPLERRLVADLGYLGEIGGSSLTDTSMEVRDAELDEPGIPTSYVPFRNAHLVCIGVSWAEVIGAERVAIGVVEQDSSGYPDCRQVFYDALNRVVDIGTKPSTHIHVATPLVTMRKGEIIKLGLQLGAPLHLTWSCYRANDLACGTCDSCVLRLRGFQEAGTEDPIPYADTVRRAL